MFGSVLYYFNKYRINIINFKMVKQNKRNKDEGEGEDGNLSAFQIKERKQRTCFVGNLPLEMTGK